MKAYYIFVGIKNGDDFTHKCNSQNEADALIEAKGKWNHLTDYDKKRHAYFDLSLVEEIEDGVPEFDRTPIWEAI